MRLLIGIALGLVLAGPVRAEVREIIVAQQYGLSFLPLMVMESQRLVEQRAAAAGLPELKVQYRQVAGPSVINDGLISGAVQFGALGAPSMITLWERTRSNAGIMGVAAITTYPLYLLTRNPAVQTPRDLSEKDKIAVPSVKISTQAIMLQMLAAQLYGDAAWQRFDPLTVGLSHPDATQAMLSGTAGVNGHFSSSPFYEQEIKMPGVRVLTTNYEILGGPATALVLATSRGFREANPTAYRAFLDALADAIGWINADKRRAAVLYLELVRDSKTPVEEIVQVIGEQDYAYTMRPAKVFATAQFMAKVGTLKTAPRSLADMFFPEAAALGGD